MTKTNNTKLGKFSNGMKTITKLWIFLAILIALTPLGIFIPEYFKSGPAWGEWGEEELAALVGYIPKGLAGLSSAWPGPVPDYGRGATGYIGSAILGILVITAAAFSIGKCLSKKDKP